MPILFDFYASPSDPEKEEKEKYHARVVYIFRSIPVHFPVAYKA